MEVCLGLGLLLSLDVQTAGKMLLNVNVSTTGGVSADFPRSEEPAVLLILEDDTVSITTVLVVPYHHAFVLVDEKGNLSAASTTPSIRN